MDQWVKEIENFKSSGKSQRVWCSERGIKRSTLRYWLDRYEDILIGKEITFAEIVAGDGQC